MRCCRRCRARRTRTFRDPSMGDCGHPPVSRRACGLPRAPGAEGPRAGAGRPGDPRLWRSCLGDVQHRGSTRDRAPRACAMPRGSARDRHEPHRGHDRGGAALGLDAVGLCELPYVMQQTCDAICGAPTQLEYVGLNHFAWITGGSLKHGGDCTNDLLAQAARSWRQAVPRTSRCGCPAKSSHCSRQSRVPTWPTTTRQRQLFRHSMGVPLERRRSRG